MVVKRSSEEICVTVHSICLFLMKRAILPSARCNHCDLHLAQTPDT